MYEQVDVVGRRGPFTMTRPVAGPFDNDTGEYVGAFTVTELIERGVGVPEAMWIVLGIPVEIGRRAESDHAEILSRMRR